MAPARRQPEEERMHNLTARGHDGGNHYEDVNVADVDHIYGEIERRAGPIRKIKWVLIAILGIVLVAACIFIGHLQITSKSNSHYHDNKLNAMEETVNKLKATATSRCGTGNAGSSFVHWGSKICSDTAELVYTGFVGGQHYNNYGGATNLVCLPLTPEYHNIVAENIGNYIYGAEYETGSNIFEQSLQNQNVPCARCYVPQRSTTIMIPAIRSCPDSSWTKEYEGYLMSGHYSHKTGFNYVCVDETPDVMPGLHGDVNGATLHFVQAKCDHLGRCPDYIEAAELTCVVCSK